jgi:dienelactone hydrolase
MKLRLIIPLLMATTSISSAAIKIEPVEYKQGDTPLEGWLAYDDAAAGRRPGVLVVHDYYGVSDFAKERAGELAKLGYVAFVADIYGKGVRPGTPADAGAEAGKYRNDRPLLRARVSAALDILKNNPNVDPARIAAIGYCFGGMGVLELARSGADIAGVVSFHGSLDTPTPQDAKNIRCKVLILHGADDQHAPAAQVAALEDEMRAAGVDYQVVLYGGAVHAFTRPDSGTDPSKGVAYNEKADKRSWQAMKVFFAEIFGTPK